MGPLTKNIFSQEWTFLRAAPGGVRPPPSHPTSHSRPPKRASGIQVSSAAMKPQRGDSCGVGGFIASRLDMHNTDGQNTGQCGLHVATPPSSHQQASWSRVLFCVCYCCGVVLCAVVVVLSLLSCRCAVVVSLLVCCCFVVSDEDVQRRCCWQHPEYLLARSQCRVAWEYNSRRLVCHQGTNNYSKKHNVTQNASLFLNVLKSTQYFRTSAVSLH